MRIASLIAISLILGGCASLPDDLTSPEGQALLPFADSKTVAASQQKARWGGEIVTVRNLAQGSQVEVVQFVLSSNGYPVKSDNSGGRFRIETSNFIDPAIYKAGRKVTALGEFDRIESGKIDEQPYNFPILKTESVHLWPEVKDPPAACDCDPFWGNSLMHRPIIVVPAKQPR